MDNKNLAACFVTLLQKELKSDVARFTANNSNLSCIKSGCCKLREYQTFNWIKLRGSHAIHESYIRSCSFLLQNKFALGR